MDDKFDSAGGYLSEQIESRFSPPKTSRVSSLKNYFLHLSQTPLEDYENFLNENEHNLRKKISAVQKELKFMGIAKKLVDNLSVVSYNGQRRFINRDYSIADQVELVKVKLYSESDFFGNQWHIEFSAPLGDERVYCRHKEWGQDSLHLAGAVYHIVKSSGQYDYHYVNWIHDKNLATLDTLISFYAKQEVHNELLRKMEKEVMTLRQNIKERKNDLQRPD